MPIATSGLCRLYSSRPRKNAAIYLKVEREKRGVVMKRNKNLRRLSVLVTAQTLYNLQRLANMTGSRNVGRVVDKLTREKMLALRGKETAP